MIIFSSISEEKILGESVRYIYKKIILTEKLPIFLIKRMIIQKI